MDKVKLTATHPKESAMPPVLVFLLFLIIPCFAHSQLVEQDFGNLGALTGPGLSGTRQSFGNTDYFSFSDGSFTTRQSFDNTEYYIGSTPSLSGTVQRFNNLGYGTWSDGSWSLHQSFDGLSYHSFQHSDRSFTCVSQRFGNQTFTTCN